MSMKKLASNPEDELPSDLPEPKGCPGCGLTESLILGQVAPLTFIVTCDDRVITPGASAGRSGCGWIGPEGKGPDRVGAARAALELWNRRA